MTREERDKILVEVGEGGCWHGAAKFEQGSASGLVKIFCDCGLHLPNGGNWPNPNFSEWANFGRLLKIASKNLFFHHIIDFLADNAHGDMIDQIPALIADELARILSTEVDTK